MLSDALAAIGRVPVRSVPRAILDPGDRLMNLPNRITLVRTVISMTAACWAFHAGGWGWLVAGYLVYWAGDIIDGAVARVRDEETVVGAVLDVVCDRACTFLLAGAFIASYPAVTGPLALYLIQFGVLDTMLTFAFLLWPGVISPNYFYRVDRRIWWWNWSKPAKALNTTSVIVALILGLSYDLIWLAWLAAGFAAVVKIASTVRLARILNGRT